MANTDLMIDLETLASSNDAAIVTMAPIRFDPMRITAKSSRRSSITSSDVQKN